MLRSFLHYANEQFGLFSETNTTNTQMKTAAQYYSLFRSKLHNNNNNNNNRKGGINIRSNLLNSSLNTVFNLVYCIVSGSNKSIGNCDENRVSPGETVINH